MTTTFSALPTDADWYYNAIVTIDGETDYIDGFATGDRPTRTAMRQHHGLEQSIKIHEWSVRRTPQSRNK